MNISFMEVSSVATEIDEFGPDQAGTGFHPTPFVTLTLHITDDTGKHTVKLFADKRETLIIKAAA